MQPDTRSRRCLVAVSDFRVDEAREIKKYGYGCNGYTISTVVRRSSRRKKPCSSDSPKADDAELEAKLVCGAFPKSSTGKKLIHADGLNYRLVFGVKD